MERLHSLIAPSIARFFKERPHGRFHMTELVARVMAEVPGNVAPDSPSRIMRMMRQDGKINYTLVSRHGSLYEVV